MFTVYRVVPQLSINLYRLVAVYVLRAAELLMTLLYFSQSFTKQEKNSGS